MIVDDVHRFVFVHIPKCAGSTVHAQLSAWDSRDPAFHRPGRHPHMGDVHFAHLPLAFLRAHYPTEFDKLTQYHSFALTRDPRSRFVSALLQRLREFRGVRDLNLDRTVIVNEAHHVIEWLTGRGVFSDLEYIHFSRQADYVRLDGVPVVANVYAVETLEAFAAALNRLCGVTVDPQRRENKNLASDNRVLAALHLAKPVYSRLTSWQFRERLLLFLRRATLGDSASLDARVLRDRKTARFVEDFYAEDEALHRASGLPAAGLSMR
jgi:hypothetical protein